MFKQLRKNTAIAAALAGLLLAGFSADSSAQEEPHRGRPVDASLDYERSPLGEGAITPEMESGDLSIPPGVTCTWESVLSGPNAAPSSPSFQHLYVVPADQAAAATLDTPRSCSDGSVLHSSIAKASRNLATWQERRQAGLNYRTINGTYVHNYTSQSYSARSVRRYRSSYTRAELEAQPIKAQDNTSPRLRMVSLELKDDGFEVANTRYAIVLHTDAQLRVADGYCGYTVGAATVAGKYGFTTRELPGCGTWTKTTIFYGCASSHGDGFLAHEMTHQVGASADHVWDHSYDLMLPSKPHAQFNTSPYLLWDYNRNDYHSTVYGSVYVVKSGLAGSYYTCSA